MKNINLTKCNWIVGAALILSLIAGSARAEISLDDEFPWRKQDVGYALAGVGSLEAAINRDQAAQGFEQKSYGTINFFHMLWNSRTFYVAGLKYTSREQWAEYHRAAAAAGESDGKILPGGGVCALFVYDEHLKQAAKYSVKFNEADGKTWCNGANAIARVKGQDALLFSVSYYLTDKPLAKKMKDIGTGWRYMTVLLRLKEQDGKVIIEQDDSCLGNPNAYEDIPSARQALAACRH